MKKMGGTKWNGGKMNDSYWNWTEGAELITDYVDIDQMIHKTSSDKPLVLLLEWNHSCEIFHKPAE